MSTNSGERATSAPALRALTPGWRDPRLWIGVAIVAVSVIVGARVLAAADDTVAMWSLTEELATGALVLPEDVEVRRVRFAEPADLDRYLAADEAIPPGATLVRGVGSGELLPRSALGSAEDVDTVEVPIAVEDEQIPGSVNAGAVVDVYLLAPAPATDDNGTKGISEGPVLSGVEVLDAPPIEQSFGTSGKRQIVLGVPPEKVDGFFAAMGRSDSAALTIVRVS